MTHRLAALVALLIVSACSGNLPLSTIAPTASVPTVAPTIAPTPFASSPAPFTPDSSTAVGTLAYQTYDSAPHIHLRDRDGGNDRFLVDGAHPDWSPDGTQIAYQIDIGSIWVINADASDAHDVYTCRLRCALGDSPAWSPDGKTLAFTEINAKDGQALLGYILGADVDTGEQRVLVKTLGPDYPFYPRWSPDGNSLVISIQRFATKSVEGDCQPTGSAVAIVDLTTDSPEPRLLTDFDMFADYPDWSPDGQSIVFTTYDLGTRDACTIDPAEPSDIYTIRPDGSGLTQLTHNASGGAVIRNRTATGPLSTQPSWMPDGASIIYNQVDGMSWPGYQVWTMNADGSGAAPFASGKAISGSHPRLSH